ncbi:acyl-CoA dehydrogenase family protein [Halobacillus kuroshimensis]|uniref:Acyl-CoA dehydrogenase family protein n=1 Tax=Halobacillus kuroshimensis TaxID=302481 RepID=A0ABS3DX39_9BACI|nr:acyl-CoA dehydrogenase family protein [Halobacillus kuroshimensis]MBN8235942.1 acyl-CoA dehydrogenase family protein [Halobacillus kuroshimensis]
MHPVKHEWKGGRFLTSDVDPEAVFTPEDQTEEHRMIGRTARQFIEGEVRPHRERIERGDYDFVARKMKKAGDLGLLAHSIPEKYGGLGLDKISKGIVGEALGSAGGYSVAHSNHTCIATLPITYFGSEEQKKKYLPKLASGAFIGAYCLTEPEAGSDALSAKTTAVMNESGSHYVLNGTKIYITNAAFSDTFIVYAKVDGEHFTAFIVEKDLPGLSIGPEEDKMGIKGSSTCSVVMEDCQVPAENLLGDVGRGHLIALNVLNLGRFNLGFATLGAAKYSFQLALAHASERRQFRKAITDFRASKQKLAWMAADLYAAESVMYRTAGHIESALAGHYDTEDKQAVAKAMNEHRMEAAICKIVGSETLDRVVDEAVQLHGGAGFIKEYPVEQAYRDARINRIFEGTNEINRLLIPGAFFQTAGKAEIDTHALVKQADDSLKTGGYKREQGPVPKLEEAVALCKDLYLVSAGAAYKIYGSAIKDEQETLMELADIAIEIYRSESSVLRAKKGSGSSSLHLQLAETVIERSVENVRRSVGRLFSSLLRGEERTKALRSAAALLSVYSFEGSLDRNRRLAEQMVESGHYKV